MEKKYAHKHEYRLVYGQNIKVRELPDWSEAKLTSLLQFFSFFINPETDQMRINQERIKEFEVRSENEPYWMEWRSRIGLELEEIEAKPKMEKMKLLSTYKMRILTMLRNVLGWLKNNPHAISVEMRDMMIRTERMSWALKDFKVETTAIGVPIVVPDNRETTDPDVANVSPGQTSLTLAELSYQRSITQLASIAADLTRNIKREDLRKMSSKDRIKVSLDIVNALSKSLAANKPNTQIFKQLNINKASAEELEKAMLDFNQSQ